MQVVELGGFTRAAGTLRVAQPALSRQIRQLEVELRQTLLLRNGRVLFKFSLVFLQSGYRRIYRREFRRGICGSLQYLSSFL